MGILVDFSRPITAEKNLKNLVGISTNRLDTRQECGIVCVSKDGFRLVGLTTVQRQGEAETRDLYALISVRKCEDASTVTRRV
jgi:hypothetical protein